MFSGLLESFLRKPVEWLSSESESEEDEEEESLNLGGVNAVEENTMNGTNAECITTENNRPPAGNFNLI